MRLSGLKASLSFREPREVPSFASARLLGSLGSSVSVEYTFAAMNSHQNRMEDRLVERTTTAVVHKLSRAENPLATVKSAKAESAR